MARGSSTERWREARPTVLCLLTRRSTCARAALNGSSILQEQAPQQEQAQQAQQQAQQEQAQQAQQQAQQQEQAQQAQQQ